MVGHRRPANSRPMGQLGLVRYTPGQVSKLPTQNRLAGARRDSVALRATLFITAQARGIASLSMIKHAKTNPRDGDDYEARNIGEGLKPFTRHRRAVISISTHRAFIFFHFRIWS